jgi:hypothetical protein
MEMAMYLVTAVLTEGRSAREVADAHGASKTWVYELLARYRAEGEPGLAARSRRPQRSPMKVAHRFEDDIVRIRKELVEDGFDAGAGRGMTWRVGSGAASPASGRRSRSWC